MKKYALFAITAILMSGCTTLSAPLNQLILFGCPKIGYEKLQKLIEFNCPNISSFKNHNDIVTTLPPFLYHHVKELTQILSMPTPMTDIQAHEIARYVQDLSIK